MDLVSLLLLIALPALLVMSGLFSGTETALFSLTPHESARLAQRQHAAPQAVTRLLSAPRGLLMTLLIANMLINVLYFTLSTVLINHWQEMGMIGGPGAGGVAVLTLLSIIVVGEVLPKQVAAQRATNWSLIVARPMLMFHRSLAPMRSVLERAVVSPLARLFEPGVKPPEFSPDELDAVLTLSRRGGAIDHGEQQMLRKVLELGQLRVLDLMVPRVAIHGHNIDRSAKELIDLARETRLRHLPVYEGSLDKVIGIALSRDILMSPPASSDEIRRLLKPAHFVPEIVYADALLTKLREASQTIAIVVDEYGGTSGLVSLEDIVEQVVGDIPGAYDSKSEEPIESAGDGAYRVDAGLAVREWAELFGQNPTISEMASGAATLGGLVMAALGRLPEVGDTVSLGNIVLKVDRMQGRCIETLLVTLRDETSNDLPESQRDKGGGNE